MRIYLKKQFFSEQEFVLAETESMRAVAFRYSTGVEALRIENNKGYFIILPFQGQQIWRAKFCGKDLTMKTKLEEPVPTTEYLRTYGGFLLHCGLGGIGSPKAEDKHPQHGEIPNVQYNTVYIDVSDDCMAVSGCYHYDMSFVKNYTFSPRCCLGKDDTVLKINVTIENRRNSPMEYMYLCHINFRPVDGAELVYSGDYNNVRVYKSGNESGELLEYVNDLEKNPLQHHVVGGKNQNYNPEICLGINYAGDENNCAYTLQCFDDGACYVKHPVDALPYAIRWISRTGDEDSMGMVLPATSEHLGYTHAKKNGQVKVLPGNSSISFEIEAGYIDKEQLENVKKKIANIK